jgi:phosphatidylserine/phosphatidylglycerophosphate/cardiolipin synthase-like enzyme
MKIINIAIPVLKSRAKFIVDKGRSWSIIEHLLLNALSKQSWTASSLATHANLPRGIVIESIIRLMRAGWVELSQATNETLFRANIFGELALDQSELPSILERKNRPTNFIVDLLVGSVFRNREWSVFTEQTIKERALKEHFIILTAESEQTSIDISGMLDILLDPDEVFVSAEPKGVTRRYVIVTIKDGVILGLPDKRDLTNLKARLMELYESHPFNRETYLSTVIVPGVRHEEPEAIPLAKEIHFNTKDIILDGDAHHKALINAIDKSRTKLIIHSTFIDEQNFRNLLPNLKESAQRGVITHIFWGQNESRSEASSSRAAINAIFSDPELLEFSSSIIVHPHSTGSHSKFIISDSGTDGEFIAIVGSCNWFTSQFKTYEASVLLRDPSLVKDVLTYASRLCCVHDGIWTDLATEFAQIGRKLSLQPRTNKTNALATLVIGSQHSTYMLRARDEAKENIFITSHRLGGTLYSSVLPSSQEAVSKNGIRCEIYYGLAIDLLSPEDIDRVISSAFDAGVTIRTLGTPKLHAKILAWDNENILISSLNWLSADPKGTDNLKELGIYIQAKGAASLIRSDFLGKTANSIPSSE